MVVTITQGPGRTGHPYQVVQRSSATAVVGLSAKASITATKATHMKVRVRNVSDDSVVLDWHSPATQVVTTGTVSFTIDESVPTGGWYKWSFRLYSGNTLLVEEDHSVAWGVGVVGLLLGQSNMQEMWTTFDSPTASNTRVSVWLNGVPEGSTLSTSAWGAPSEHDVGDGVYKLAAEIQAGLADDSAHGDIPVGLVGAAIGATSLLSWANWASAGCWLTEIGGGSLEAYIDSTLKAATGERRVEFVAWHQGEAEATARFVNGRSPKPNEYGSALRQLYDTLSDICETHHSTLPFIVGTVGRLFTYDSTVTLSTSSLYAETQVVNDDVQTFVESGSHGYFSTFGVPALTTGAYYGLHYTAAGYETVGARMASSVLATIGVSPSSSTVSRRGPKVLYGVMGDDTATDDDKYLRTKFTLWVEHDQGTDLTLGTDSSIPAFEVFDEFGPLAITAITKGSTASGKQPLVFTVERVTTETASAASNFDYDAENHIRGNRVIVKYLGNASIEDDYMIVDDEGVPVRPTWGANGSDAWKWSHAAVYANSAATPPVYRIAAEITAVASPSDTVTLEAPSGWAVSGITTNKMLRPGDRYAIRTSAGLYVATGTVRKVADYVDNSTAVDVDLSHTMALDPPSVGDLLIVNPGLSRAGGIVVMPRTPSHYGEVYGG